jgi:hypothetical protein
MCDFQLWLLALSCIIAALCRCHQRPSIWKVWDLNTVLVAPLPAAVSVAAQHCAQSVACGDDQQQPSQLLVAGSVTDPRPLSLDP